MTARSRVTGRLNRLGSLRHHRPVPLDAPDEYCLREAAADPPTVSVVTPSLSQGRFLGTAARSVLDQEYAALEYVIKDGGSTDSTAQILSDLTHRLHYHESARDTGQANALNRGFAHTSGEIMAFLNADDLLLPGSLAYVAEYFSVKPSVDVVYGHRILIDENGMEIGRQVIPPHDDDMLSWGDFIPQETMFWRRSAWDAAGGHFNEGFECAMDWDLLVRLRDAGANMVRLPRFLGAFRVHGDQKTAVLGPTTGVEEMDRIRERIHGRPVSQDEALRKLRPYLLRHVTLDLLHRLGAIRY